MGVEPTGDRVTCRPPVLKTGTITGPHALPWSFIPSKGITPKMQKALPTCQRLSISFYIKCPDSTFSRRRSNVQSAKLLAPNIQLACLGK